MAPGSSDDRVPFLFGIRLILELPALGRPIQVDGFRPQFLSNSGSHNNSGSGLIV
jgi:hypothetical protein